MSVAPNINHYTLTKKQLIILNFLYRFRFGTSTLLSQATNISQQTINKRLKLLLKKEYIGRRYEPEYRLLRKHATYYLLPGGMKVLKQLASPRYKPDVLRKMRHDSQAKEPFVNRSLDIFSIYCVLKAKHKGSLQFFTANQLAGLLYFPKQLPDAFIQIGNNRMPFFLDVLPEHPFLIATGRVKNYIAYADNEAETWQRKAKTAFPRMLLVCENASLQKRLLKRMRRTIDGIDSTKGPKIFTTTLNEFTHGGDWRDMASPEEPLSFADIL